MTSFRNILCGVRERALFFLIMTSLPFLGILGKGEPLRLYLEFPPRSRYVEHAAFSWPVFFLMGAIVIGVCLPFVIMMFRKGLSGGEKAKPRFSFPAWGWMGVLLCGISWVFAWTRFEWFASFQHFTFTPMWLGYIVVVNALTYRWKGQCMLTHQRGTTAGLFLLSAAFWWYFELVNRFVQNWFYLNVDHFTPLTYILHATLSFSTVLPAVLGTHQWLLANTGRARILDHGPRFQVQNPRMIAGTLILGAIASLVMVGWFPNALYPFLWISPLVIVTAYQVICKESTIFAGCRKGQFRSIFLLACAGLLCGFFWEMWNFKSLAKWVYAVPYVDRFHIFHMPLMGFAGYIPFALECACLVQFITLSREGATCKADQLKTPKAASIIMRGNALILTGVALFLFLIPGVLIVRNITTVSRDAEAIPGMAWDVHKSITPGFKSWAEQRMKDETARHLDFADVPSTEWPMFSAVFYLLATEALQETWEVDPGPSRIAPAVYARDAIDAAVELVLDPIHHTWVKRLWGPKYLERENLAMRSYLISALLSHFNLTGKRTHLTLLVELVNSLVSELDASSYGYLNDYPGECYPLDVFMAVAIVKKTDQALGLDHDAFLLREQRAFSGDRLDPRGLVPYSVDNMTGRHLEPSRGIGNSHILNFAPDLWPTQAREWYERYEKHFWQERWWAHGFREYPRDLAGFDYLYEVDAGPVIAGFGTACNAFALAASRRQGRLDHYRTLFSQAVVAFWPLPGGRLLGPALVTASLSGIHAPYLGEVCCLFFLTQTPHPNVAIKRGGTLTGWVYIGLLFYFGWGTFLLWLSLMWWQKSHANGVIVGVQGGGVQLCAWLVLMGVAAGCALNGYLLPALVSTIIALVLPARKII